MHQALIEPQVPFGHGRIPNRTCYVRLPRRTRVIAPLTTGTRTTSNAARITGYHQTSQKLFLAHSACHTTTIAAG